MRCLPLRVSKTTLLPHLNSNERVAYKSENLITTLIDSLDNMADSILAPDLDVGQVDGQILATSFAKGVVGIAEGNSLGGDAVAASWKVAGEYLGNMSVMFVVC